MRIFSILILVFLISCDVQKSKVDSTNKVESDVRMSTQAEEAASDEQQIRDCFAAYKSAILNDKGEVAADQVDSRTINYYSDILAKSLTADSTLICQQNILDKLMILSVRHRTSEKDLLNFDGKELFIYSIKEGMVGKNSVANNELGEVTIDEDFGKGQLVANGMVAPMYFHFYKEDAKWKVDLTSIFTAGTAAFQAMAEESGQEENEYLFTLLELTTGEQPTEAIWKPIK